MQVTRPIRLVGVLGTHTEVGKTWVGARLLAALKAQGLTVAARKPVQSFDSAVQTDAHCLADATGESAHTVCPAHRWYPRAMAPPMAADVLGREAILLADLCAEVTWPQGIDIGLVESIGGPLSPIAHDGDSVDLLNELNVDEVLLIADAGLGTLNSVRLSLACIERKNVTVFLNRYDAEDELHQLNRDWLVTRYGIIALVDLGDLATRYAAEVAD